MIAKSRPTRLSATVACLLADLSICSAHAHPGGLNGYGCHNNRSTGDYHCHAGVAASGYEGRSARGGSGVGHGSSEPEKVCKDATRIATSITLVMTDNHQKSAINVGVRKVFARLEGVPGSLYTYTLQGLSVRRFVDSSMSSGKFSFAQSDWISVVSMKQSGDTIISVLAANGAGVAREEFAASDRAEFTCPGNVSQSLEDRHQQALEAQRSFVQRLMGR